MKYGTKVRVTSGFYEGMEGVVIHKSESNDYDYTISNDYDYTIELPHWNEGSIFKSFEESNLEIIN